MRIAMFIHEQNPFVLESANKLVNVNIQNNHPEIILDDKNILVFEDVETYYNLIGDANVFSAIDNNIDITRLQNESGVTISDTVTDLNNIGNKYGENLEIINIEDINYNGKHIYYILTRSL